MRAAMAEAEVGDDFYGEDTSIRELEARAADLLGKEAALYVPSGTMGNLLAHLVHAPGGGEVIGPEPAHSLLHERGGFAKVGGLVWRTFPQIQGEVDLERIEAMTRLESMTGLPTALIWIEQPTRGYVVQLGQLAALKELAESRELPVHFDGARIFNAAVSLGVTAAEIAQYCDSVMFCVSKSLAAPVGSLLLGTSSFIEAARLHRQMLGGGLRQGGIVAAGGLYALQHNIDRLVDDHANAQRLAQGLRQLGGLCIDRDDVETNIFYADVVQEGLSGEQFVARLRDNGVLVNSPRAGSDQVRFVTHYGVESDDIEAAIAAAAAALDSITPLDLAAADAPVGA
jgi:threonine aldolase